MKIYYKRNTLTWDGVNYSVDVLKRVEEQCKCIDKINHRIDTSDHDDNNDDFNNIKLNFYLVEPVIETEADYDYEDRLIFNAVEDEYLIPINFCPICGDKIELILEETVDHTEELKPLLDELVENEKKRSSKARRERGFEIVTKIQRTMLERK